MELESLRHILTYSSLLVESTTNLLILLSYCQLLPIPITRLRYCMYTLYELNQQWDDFTQKYYNSNNQRLKLTNISLTVIIRNWLTDMICLCVKFPTICCPILKILESSLICKSSYDNCLTLRGLHTQQETLIKSALKVSPWSLCCLVSCVWYYDFLLKLLLSLYIIIIIHLQHNCISLPIVTYSPTYEKFFCEIHGN